MAPASSDPPYYLVPDLRALDPSAREIELNAHAWIQTTIIEDEDLTFGGKSLSAWYEEDRRRHSGYSDEEEQRGRQRVRKHHNSRHHHHQGSKTQNSSSSSKTS